LVEQPLPVTCPSERKGKFWFSCDSKENVIPEASFFKAKFAPSQGVCAYATVMPIL
jgi:hypothetical protein